jgi:AraC-like DNA-binding protein
MNMKPDKNFRKIYNLKDYGFPEVPLFGKYKFNKAFPGLGIHTHPAFEICYLVEGRQIYSADGKDYQLKAGDLFITQPIEPHSSGWQPQEKGSLFWMHIMPALQNKPYLGMVPQSGEELTLQLHNIYEKCFPGNEIIYELFKKIYYEISTPEHQLKQITIANAITGILLEIVKCSQNRQLKSNSSFEKILLHIDKNINFKICIHELAYLAGISESYFKAKFKQEIGMPPAEYILRRKIAKGKELLESGKGNVTEVAFSLGFSSSQHFSTVFLRFTGTNPSKCRRTIKNK